MLQVERCRLVFTGDRCRRPSNARMRMPCFQLTRSAQGVTVGATLFWRRNSLLRFAERGHRHEASVCIQQMRPVPVAGALFFVGAPRRCPCGCSQCFSQPDFCAVLALETCDYPSDDLKDFFDPHSAYPQRRALCCLFLDNQEWTDKQRQILVSKSWGRLWKKLECVCGVWRCVVLSV